MDPVSAIGLADNCLSFANALYSYITIVASAKDDIQRVSGELQATSVVLRDLGRLIEKYQNTNAWKGERMSYAQGCIDKAEKNIAKMKEMLLKTTTTTASASSHIKPDDVDLNKIQLLVFWPWRRSKLEERSAELAGSKTDILLAYMMYTAAAVPNSEEGKKAAAEIPDLFRASRVARRQIRKSKQRSKRFQGPSRQYSRDALPNNADVSGPYEYDSDDEVLIYENEEDLRQDFEDWSREREVKKKEDTAKQNMLELQAVEAWKKTQREKAQQQLREVNEQRAKLQTELEKQRLAPQQIRDTLDHLHPLPRYDIDLALIASNGEGGDLTTSPTTSPQDEPQQNSSKQSVWSFLFGTRTKTRGDSSAHSDIPTILQDMRKPGGVAEIAVLLFEKVSAPAGPKVVRVNFEIEPQWLINTLREIEARNKKSDFDPALKEFATLPPEYRYAISEVMDSRAFDSDYNSKWILIFVRCLKIGKSQSWFKSSRDRVQSVYVALKRVAIVTANDELNRQEPLLEAGADKEKLPPNTRQRESALRSQSRQSIYHSSNSDNESDEVFEPRRAARSRSRQALRPHLAEASIAKRANRRNQTRADDIYATENESRPVARYDDAYSAPIIINNALHRPRSRERTRPRKHTYDTEGMVSRRQETYDDGNYWPVVLAQPQAPYAATSVPVRFAPTQQPHSAQYDTSIYSDYYQHRRRGDTYNSVQTSRPSMNPMSERRQTSNYSPSRRRTTTDSYEVPRHIRFAETPQEIVVRRHRSRSHYLPDHRAQTPSNLANVERAMKQNEYESSSSSSDDDVNGVDSELEQIEPGLSDEGIIQRLLSRFQRPGIEELTRSTSAPASFFGGAISDEPGSNSPAAGSDIVNNIVVDQGTAHTNNTRTRTVESID